MNSDTGLEIAARACYRSDMSQPQNTAPETVTVTTHRVSCDGTGGIRSATPSALGHPHVWLEIDERGYVDCPYCDKRFVTDKVSTHAH